MQRSDCAYFNNEVSSTVVAAQGRTSNYSCIPSREEDVLIHADNDEDDFQVFDDAIPCDKEFDDDSNNEDTPDGIILQLYEEMQDLQSNPLGLDRFSCEEKVHIELLHLLKDLKAPLKAFSCILIGQQRLTTRVMCSRWTLNLLVGRLSISCFVGTI